jgi:hypothetical protein
MVSMDIASSIVRLNAYRIDFAWQCRSRSRDWDALA